MNCAIDSQPNGRRRRASLTATFAVVLCLAAAPASPPTPTPGTAGPLAIVAGTVLQVGASQITPGVILVRDGKIEEIRRGTEVPDGYEILAVSSGVAMPGLVDSHTHLGLRELPVTARTVEFNENTRPFTAELRIEDSINPRSPAFQLALAHGTTTAVVLPGSSNLIGGLGLVLKTAGRDLESMRVDAPRILKAALGMNPKSAHGSNGRSPKTRMAAAAMIRERFEQAERYAARRSRDAVEVDPTLEPLAQALEGKVRVHIHSARADDMLTALRLIDDFGLQASIGHGYEAYLIGEELARSGVPLALGPRLDGWYRGTTPESPVNVAGEAERAGVTVSIMTDGYVDDLLLQARYAVRLGWSEDAALRAITLHPAALIGMEDRLGSLEPGKDADIVILDGWPFDPRSSVVNVLIGGALAFEKTASP